MIIWKDNKTNSYCELLGNEMHIHYIKDTIHETQTIHTSYEPIFGIDEYDIQRSVDLFANMEKIYAKGESDV